MAVVNPIPKENAASEVQDIYDSLTRRHGHMPNFFAVMAHRPTVLKNFLPLYSSIIGHGTIEPRFKELAYLKTAMLNACEY